MKKFPIVIITGALTLLMTTAAFAAAANPAQIIGGLTGKSEAEITAQRTEGKTFGQVAQDNGVLEEFKTRMLQYKKEVIDERVASGNLTKEQADTLKEKMEARMGACDGTLGAKQERMGQKFGGGLGFGKGQGRGMGMGRTAK